MFCFVLFFLIFEVRSPQFIWLGCKARRLKTLAASALKMSSRVRDCIPVCYETAVVQPPLAAGGWQQSFQLHQSSLAWAITSYSPFLCQTSCKSCFWDTAAQRQLGHLSPCLLNSKEGWRWALPTDVASDEHSSVLSSWLCVRRQRI